MSYHYRLSGAIGIEPPLSYAEMTEAATKNKVMDAMLCHLDPNRRRGAYASVTIGIDTSKKVTNDGLLTTFAGSIIEPSGSESSSPLEDLDLIAKTFGENHTFAGHIYGVGEGGDHMRWSIQHVSSALVVEEEAKLVWPDGSTATVAI